MAKTSPPSTILCSNWLRSLMLFLNQNWQWNAQKKYWMRWSVWNARRRKGVWYTSLALTSLNAFVALENRSYARYVANSSKKKFARIEYKTKQLRHQPKTNSPSNQTQLWRNGTKNSDGFIPMLWRNRFFLFVAYKKCSEWKIWNYAVLHQQSRQTVPGGRKRETTRLYPAIYKLTATKLCTSRKN